MSASRLFVAIVDDDESVRDSLPALLKVLGYDSAAFSSAADFLASDALHRADCLIVDVAMPGMTGPDLMRHSAVTATGVPVILITALQDELVRDEMLERGAVNCLSKPFNEEAMLQALLTAAGRTRP